ncbi:MAG: hypothetical protein VKM34_02700 [Cyanobacteriota bacterium]|nr:hypothetical protein [Cyanobacteriota bacterium]
MTHDPTTTAALYLQRRYAGEHPYTLALRVQCLTGRELSGAGMKRTLEHLEQQAEPPLRCHAAEVMQQLRLIAAGVADFKLAAPVGWNTGALLKVDGWVIQLVQDGEALALTHRAVAPDGRQWAYGCERDDWSLGPDSRIIDPLGLMAADEREQLLEVLQQQPAPACKGVMPMTASRPAQQAAEASAKRSKRAA